MVISNDITPSAMLRMNDITLLFTYNVIINDRVRCSLITSYHIFRRILFLLFMCLM